MIWRPFMIGATAAFILLSVICAADAVFGAASPVNVTVSPEIVNVTVEQEGAPTVTVTTTVGEVMNIVTAGEQGPPGAPGPAGVSSWDDLSDKPLAFPPEAHNQATSTITGLDTLLSGKEPILPAGTIAQYLRGNKSLGTLNQAAVAGLTSGSSPTFAAVTATNGMYAPFFLSTFPTENYNSFAGAFKGADSVSTNIFAGKAPKLKVSVNGVESTTAASQITKLDYEGYGNIIKGVDGDPPMVVNIDLVSNGLYSSSGVIYSSGLLYLNFYTAKYPSTIAGRIKDKNGVWTAITFGLQPNTATYYATIPTNHLYLTDIELTFTTGTGGPYVTASTMWALVQIAYHPSRQSLSQGALVSAVGGYMSGDLIMAATAKIGIGKTPSDNLDVIGTGSFSASLTAPTAVLTNIQTGITTKTVSSIFTAIDNIPAAQIKSDWAASGNIAEILNKPAFTRGYDGREIELQVSATHIQWRYLGDTTWLDLMPLATITGSNGTDGTDGDNIICTITAGIRTLLYDKSGSNPTPTMVPFGVEYRINGSVVTPATYAWSVPASGSLLSGSAAGATFTPTVAGTFSLGAADNRVDVTVTYAGKTCKATAPVPATKVGDDGAAATADNKQQIYTKIGAATNGDVLNTQCGPADADSFACRTMRAKGGDIHRTDLAVGQTWIHARPTDTATTPKFGIKNSSGSPVATWNADGSFTGPLVIR